MLSCWSLIDFALVSISYFVFFYYFGQVGAFTWNSLSNWKRNTDFVGLDWLQEAVGQDKATKDLAMEIPPRVSLEIWSVT